MLDDMTDGWFLLRASCYSNDGEDSPDFLPFKIGDSMEKIYELFGEPVKKEPLDFGVNEYWGDFNIILGINYSADTIDAFSVEKSGW